MSVSTKMLQMLGEAAPVDPTKVRAEFVRAAELALELRAAEQVAAQKVRDTLFDMFTAVEALKDVYLQKKTSSANAVNKAFGELEELAGNLSDYHEDEVIPDVDSPLARALDNGHIRHAMEHGSETAEEALRYLKLLGEIEESVRHIAADWGSNKAFKPLKADLDAVRKMQ